MKGLIFATEQEAAPFFELVSIKKERDEPFLTYSITLPDTPDNPLLVVISGMGWSQAAKAAEMLVEKYGVDKIINAGISGALVDRIDVGTIYRVTETRFGPGTPGYEPDVSYPLESTDWPDLPGARLITCEEPVYDNVLRYELAFWGELIDMEGAAIARVCRDHQVSLSLVKGVSDYADVSGREMLQKNLDAVSKRIADILLDGLGARSASSRSSTFARVLRFIKVEHTIFSVPLLFAGAWLGVGHGIPSGTKLLLILLAGIGARIFGMTINRIADRRLDALNPRTAVRELPSGQLTIGQSYLVLGMGLLLYLVACVLLGPICAMLSPIPLIPLIFYSYLKRFTSLCHFGIGVVLALAPLSASVAVSGSMVFSVVTWLLALFAFCWISGFDIIYALQDIESDRKTGVHSIPAALGYRRAQVVAAFLHFIAFGSVVAMLLLMDAWVIAWGCLAVAGAAFVLAYVPAIPLPKRFFPLSAIAGVSGALVPLLGGLV